MKTGSAALFCALQHRGCLSGADRSSNVIEFFPKNEVIMRLSRDSHASGLLPKSQLSFYVAVQELRVDLEGSS